MAYLFPHRSYLFAVNFEKDFLIQLKDLSSDYDFRVVSEESLSTLPKAIQKISHPVGVLLRCKDQDPLQLNAMAKILKEKFIPARFFEAKEPMKESNPAIHVFEAKLNGNTFQKGFGELLHSLVPANLENLVKSAANSVFPNFFPGFNNFRVIDRPRGRFDTLLKFYTVTGDIVGQCTLKVNLSELKSKMTNPSNDHLIEATKECVNQFLGAMNKSLSHIQFYPKVGLPTVYDLTKIPEISSSVHFPAARVTDKDNFFLLSLGYLNLERGPLFDLTKIKEDKGDDDIEFF